MGIKIEPFNEEHIDGILEVERESFAIPWSKESFCNELKNDIASYFVLTDNGEVLGYVGIWHIMDEGHITNIAIKKDKRNNGYATILLDKILEFANDKSIYLITLEVRVSNTSAKNLYNKFGFVPIGIRKKYYEDNKEDALIMTKYLSEG